MSEEDDDLYSEDSDDFEEDDEDVDLEDLCCVPGCHEEGICECDCCGAPLCPMHSELGAGFCEQCPTGDFHGPYTVKEGAD